MRKGHPRLRVWFASSTLDKLSLQRFAEVDQDSVVVAFSFAAHRNFERVIAQQPRVTVDAVMRVAVNVSNGAFAVACELRWTFYDARMARYCVIWLLITKPLTQLDTTPVIIAR